MLPVRDRTGQHAVRGACTPRVLPTGARTGQYAVRAPQGYFLRAPAPGSTRVSLRIRLRFALEANIPNSRSLLF